MIGDNDLEINIRHSPFPVPHSPFPYILHSLIFFHIDAFKGTTIIDLPELFTRYRYLYLFNSLIKKVLL